MFEPRRALRRPSVILLLLALAAFGPGIGHAAAKKAGGKKAPAQASGPAFEPSLLQAMAWREVGPYRGGRSAAATGIPGDPQTYYFGATGGGVWKTQDGGTSWKNVSDGFFGGSIGAVAVSEWDPNVVYVGGGEVTVRGNVSHGGGVWRSTDAGKTWKHMGLAQSRHIPRIRIHPKDPDLVYVAALGHLFGPNEERGVFRSTDGGASWEKVLFVSDQAGAVDLAMDPTNPRILYAGFWRVIRTPWSLESGGEGSGLWKSTDGGDTWQELTAKPGLPRGTWGIVGITVSPSDPENLYAIIEAEEGGVFRSRDGGETWERTNDERKLRQRAWYYSRIYADPADAESVYVVNVRFHRSKDGGKSFSPIATPHGDNHDLWVAPEDPKRMIETNDGGANVSFDGGSTWSTQANQPTAQMYRVSTDNSFPYRLLGGQQDNSTVRIRSRSADRSSIGLRDWEPTAGGESGYVVARPDDPDVIFGGSYGGYLTRVNHDTGEIRAVNVWPDDPMGWGAGELRYRFQWNFPIFFSPHDPKILYAAANVLFKSADDGQSWQAVSGDLTRNDKAKQEASGGPITKDNTSVEYYGTLFAAAESPRQPGLLWVGSDDGLLHVSKDGGKNWQDVTPPDLPEWALINSLEASPFEDGGLYLAATRYKLDDFAPYLYKTSDFGATWTKITAGIEADHFTRVIRADPERRGLLYAGTEQGIYVSFDDGGRWQPLQLNLPIVPVTDLALKEGDLIAATQGRGFWILDDLSVLHQVTPEVASAPVHLFAPRPAYRLRGGEDDDPGTRGTNPPAGALFYYYLGAEVDAEAPFQLEILEEGGDVIRTFTRKPEPGEETEKKEADGDEEGEQDHDKLLPAKMGLNRVAWDLTYPRPASFPRMVLWNGVRRGPRAVPGAYKARLTVGEETQEVPFTVLADPRTSVTQEGFEAQWEFLHSTGEKLSEVHRQIRRIRQVRSQLDGLQKRLKGEEESEVVEAAKALDEAMTEVEKALYQTQNRSRQDPLNFPIRLNDKLSGLLQLVGFGDSPPTEQALAVREELVGQIDEQLARLGEIWRSDLPAFNDLAREKGVPAVIVEEPQEPGESEEPGEPGDPGNPGDPAP